MYDDARLVPVRAPHLEMDAAASGLPARRGVVDAVALRLRFSDPALHARLMPGDPVQRLVFEWLEQLRVESLAPAEMPGMRRNVERHYRDWSDAYLGSGAAESRLGRLIFALSQIVWTRLSARPLPEDIADFVQSTYQRLTPVLGPAFIGIRRHRRDQARFARYALDIAREIARRIEIEVETAPEPRRQRAGARLLALDFDDEAEGASPSSAGMATWRADSVAAVRYRVFTTRYDQECQAADLVRGELLRVYRARLDRRIVSQGVNQHRLVRALRAVLAQPQCEGWDFGQEAGVVDGRRLSQLVSSPGERRIFRTNRVVPVVSVAATLLIDCSGSMRAAMELTAVMVDVLMRALEQAGAVTEILGFTTAAWNGGRAREDWLAMGRPSHPGRLSEVRHLVFKAAGTDWHRARRPLAALLKNDLLREGVDGEAVDWACARLRRSDAARRLLVVFSDGCPMDTATSRANGDFYLDDHLREVVARNTRQHGIDICGVGVGVDLGTVYPRALAVDVAQGLDNAVFDAFVRLVDRRRR